MRPLRVWSAFLVCAALLIGGAWWFAAKVNELERAQEQSRAAADAEETVRIALWRMESTLVALVGREAGRPAFHYVRTYPVERPFTALLEPVRDSVIAFSPLAEVVVPYVLLHFQIGADGSLTSPQVLGEPTDQDASATLVGPERVARCRELLRVLTEKLAHATPDSLLGRAREPAGESIADATPIVGREIDPVTTRRSKVEFAARRLAVDNAQKLGMNRQSPAEPMLFSAMDTVRIGVLKPAWCGDALVLIREAEGAGRRWVQGCWLDLPALSESLAASVADLLPAARLVPVLSDSEPAPDARRLAALPLALVPGPVASGRLDASASSPVRASLWIASSAVALAVLAGAALLAVILRFAERQRTFVSTVTHELRTPLTTLRMYSDLLAEGRVREPEQVDRYLATLQREAARLALLVENVLAFARIEGSRHARPSAMPAEPLIERALERSRERASRAALEIACAVRDSARNVRAIADAGAVEQILFNLVDNACKYAADARDRTIDVELAATDDRIVVRVADHGPGVAADAAAKLFRSFSRSDREAAGKAPGVGLGLALSRRLARGMGGDLALAPAEPSAPGACFVLTLRRERD